MLREIVLVLTITLAVAEESKVQNVPVYRKDYGFSKDLNAFYKEHSVALTWTDAFVTCRAEGASLFVPNSSNETKRMFKMLSNNTFAIWLGIHDRFAEGVFVTVKGVPVRDTYSNWWRNEPDDGMNNVIVGEDCVILNRDGFYYDNNCSKKRKFVCLRHELNFTLNEVCNTYDPGYTYSAETNTCYKLHTEQVSWQTAYRICDAENSKLAIINDPVEVQMLTKQLTNVVKSQFSERFVIHVGFNDLLMPGVYLTNEGDSLENSGYNEWVPGKLNDHNDKQNCGGVNVYGYYENIECERKSYYFCERKASNKNVTL